MKILRNATIVFIAAITLVITGNAMAAEDFVYMHEARLLNQLGLYDGISAQSFEPDLGTAVNRETGITVLVKMFGKKNEAMALTDGDMNKILSRYDDAAQISDWAKKYIAYAVKEGMVQGSSETTISPKVSMDGRSYATIILRNMGYDIGAEEWLRAAYILTDKEGLTDSEAKRLNEKNMIKDDLVGITYSALNAKNSTSRRLIEELISEHTVSYASAEQAGFIARETDNLNTVVRDALLKGQDRIDISKYPESSSSDEVFEIVEKIVYSTPEILYFYESQYWSNGILEFKYSKDKDTSQKHMNEINRQIDSVIAKIIKPGMSDFEKEKAVHDYIINHAQYDNENLKKDTLPPEAFSAYGVLMNGTGVCESYAEAMKMFMDKLGIDNMLISGSANGEAHVWNLIKIDGDYYHVDVTWDDPVTEDSSGVLTYNYFNVTDEEIGKSHTWNAADYPACTAQAYNYYYYNNLLVKNYSDFYNAVKNALYSKSFDLTVKAVNYDKKIYDVDAVINRMAKDNPGIYYGRYIYSIDQKNGIIKVSFDQ